ncbi:fibroin-3 related protein [Beauveria bassiana ARSEF 2860]|uniref:Fibroin-3 related protein n=1 Tax=Beauveria bassiana (strain ARSEF 2860) TaxID=655819 RepID=J4UPC2_BEAB2|nr:fibroin-3 related protein [Beauveria bassiana ARSEF 2860]EJP67022.1 fibroin-3 related protein [Beauveria bassiana ARSEF 2860]
MHEIDVAMARSLRPTTWEAITHVFARHLVAQAHKRDIVGDAQQKVGDVKTAFSSWDNCMQAAYCKWPVIAIIIIGSLIILSILWCIVRCACCAKSCCCGCFSCLKCCGNCCGCCDPPGGRKHKYLDEPYIPPHHGYQQQAPMQPSFHPPPPQHHETPQYATFDTSKNQDSLPQMPSWEGASSKKVMIEEQDDAVEMNQLKKPANDPRTGIPAGAVSPMTPADSHGPYNPPNRGPPSRGPGGPGRPGGPGGPGRGYMANNIAASSSGYGNRPVSPLNEPGYGNNGYNQVGLGGPGGPGGHGNNGYMNAYNQGPGQNYNSHHDYNNGRVLDGYGLDQPYDSPDANAGSHTGGHSGAAMAGAGLAGGLAGAALAAGAIRHQSPAPGSRSYGTPQQQPVSPYTDLSAAPNSLKSPPGGGYVEMPDEPRRREEPQVNVHAAFAEMSAVPTTKSPVHEELKKEPEPIAYEMATDQVAPIELDGGYVGPIQPNHTQSSPYAMSAELAAQPATRSPTARSLATQTHHDAPEVYDPQRSPLGGAAASGAAAGQYGQYGQSARQDGMNTRSGPEGYGMRRQRTGDNGAPSPMGPQPPYGMDPRMRQSPGPMSPRSPGPRSSPGPGAGPRRAPGSRPDQHLNTSPLNTPAPNESPYNRPGFNQGPGPHRAYSPAPRQPRSPDHNVPVGRPNGQTAFAEPQPQSPITNNAGFDFTSGFARPQTSNSERRQPQQQQQGYQEKPRPYNNQAQGGWNGY